MGKKIKDSVKGDKKDNFSSDLITQTYAYINGAFNKDTKRYGYGGFIIYNNQKFIIQGNGNEMKYSNMANVGGEILSSQETIKKAIELGIKDIDIFYNYAGIEEWAMGRWKRNKEGTKEYYEFFQSTKSKINVSFKKVKGHYGNQGIREAHRLANQAAFNKKNSDKSFHENDDKKEKENKLDNENDISSFDKRHIFKNIQRKNSIYKIQQLNYKNEKLKKEFIEKIKSHTNKKYK